MRNGESRQSDSNRRPADYKSVCSFYQLSYAGENTLNGVSTDFARQQMQRCCKLPRLARYKVPLTSMKSTRKKWVKPAVKNVPIFFECTRSEERRVGKE